MREILICAIFCLGTGEVGALDRPAARAAAPRPAVRTAAQRPDVDTIPVPRPRPREMAPAAAQPASAGSTATATATAETVAAVALPVDPPADPEAQGPASGACARGKRVRSAFYWHGTHTASGERFDPEAMRAAHRTLPFGTRLTVINPRTGKSVEVVINDRGPFSPGLHLDITRRAARAIGLTGIAWVCVF